jgi:hemerythrin-like metal-binding protein
MSIELDESLLVGFDAIDQDHRDLVPLVNVFLSSLGRGAGKHSISDDIDEISVRFSAHFERENQLMAESAYPDTAAHIAEHEALLADFGKFLDSVDDASGEEIVARTRYIENWFLKHIAGSDKRLGQYLRSRAA